MRPGAVMHIRHVQYNQRRVLRRALRTWSSSARRTHIARALHTVARKHFERRQASVVLRGWRAWVSQQRAVAAMARAAELRRVRVLFGRMRAFAQLVRRVKRLEVSF